ncbi:MAG: hypothetical protein IPG89_11455 [Bacteroidetes bacterium]|nr:hypothetical protein [Bacteroidota bacterium]
MKIKLSTFCYLCLKEDGNTKEAYDNLIKEMGGNEKHLTELNNENLYEFTCPRGHKTYSQLSEEKYVILFDLGSLALLDGYSKEAVSTFSSTFERFIEFCIKVICINRSTSNDSFLKTWKAMIRQSERQIGAFYILQLLEFGETKYMMDENRIAFRNKVIHQGYIPKSSEAIEYGEYILSLIDQILIEFQIKMPESLNKAHFLKIMENGKIIKDNVSLSTSSMPTIIKNRELWRDQSGKINFSKALLSLQENSFYKDFYNKGI